ncbi:Cellulase [Enhygromyxa salina]|uniref:Cellulase n=1 Tax=Enhygromyxa salina TaxID=215803 RepID=A0A0C2D5B9_9BACT|nr:glycoside hydrolase family 5 protein [Enhygromyxa salina]KIG15207.1 Cellulase [Enhygromyxa salina]
MQPVRLAAPGFGAGRLAGCFIALFALHLGGCGDYGYGPADDEEGNASTSGDANGDGDGDPSGDGDGDGDGDGEIPPITPGGYYVKGNKIYDANHQVHVFRGVDRPSLEWDPNGEGISSADIDLIASWNANVIRVAINQGFWLEGSVVYNSGYRERVDELVQWSKAAGMDVILDLHWTDRGNLSEVPAQQRMADQNSRALWQSVAARYKDDGRVFFELYNEPHDVSWPVWLNGGDSGDGFEVVGMQELYDTVRDAGADNLVLVGGLRYAYDLSGVPDHRVEGYNIVYTSHPYDFGDKQPAGWTDDWGFLADTDPIFITEFGSFDCDAGYSQQLIDYAEQRGLSWSAWAWYPGGCGFPGLIEDWSGTPSATGQIVKTALQAN